MPVSDTIVYRAAAKFMELYGAHAMSEVMRRVEATLDRRDAERLLVWLRIRQAIQLLDSPPSRMLH